MLIRPIMAPVWLLLLCSFASSRALTNFARSSKITVLAGKWAPHEIRHGNLSITTGVRRATEVKKENTDPVIRRILSRVVHSSMDDLLQKLLKSLQKFLHNNKQIRGDRSSQTKKNESVTETADNKVLLETLLKTLIKSQPNITATESTRGPTPVMATFVAPFDLSTPKEKRTSTTPVPTTQPAKLQNDAAELEFQLQSPPAELPSNESDSEAPSNSTTEILVLSRVLNVLNDQVDQELVVKSPDTMQKEQNTPPPVTEASKVRFRPNSDSVRLLVTGAPEGQEAVADSGLVKEQVVPAKPLINPTLLCTILISSAAGFSILIFASFGLLYACYGLDRRQSNRSEPTRSISCSSADVLPQPLSGKKLLPRLAMPKPFYVRPLGRSQASLISSVADRHVETCVASPCVIERTTFDDSLETDRMPRMEDAVLY